MDITLEKAPIQQKPVLRNMMELYQHDHAQFDDADLDEHGLYGYRLLDHYWTDPGRHPFIVRVEGNLAGFALVRDPLDTGDTHCIAEFFIVRKYRKRGVGRIVAHRIFDMFPGAWAVTQVPNNAPAQAFWRKIISQYTGGCFEETIELYNNQRRPKQVFESRSPS